MKTTFSFFFDLQVSNLGEKSDKFQSKGQSTSWKPSIKDFMEKLKVILLITMRLSIEISLSRLAVPAIFF